MNVAARTASWLPYDAEVEYLQANYARMYIDTGISPYELSKPRFEVRFLAEEYDRCYFIGADGSQSNSRFSLYRGDGLEYRCGTYRQYSVDFSSWITARVEYDTGNCHYNGNLVFTLSHSNPASQGNFSIFIKDCGGLMTAGSEKISYVKLLDGEDVVRDMIPVRVGSVGYMYDRVSKQLFGNAGTGAFIVGPDVSAANGGGIS